MTAPRTPDAFADPHEARAAYRDGLRVPTAGHCPGWTQANLISLPADVAEDFRHFARRNPQACPVLGVTEPGEVSLPILDGDLRRDLPAYRVYENGELAGERTDVVDLWRGDLVTFLIGCSFTFETALLESGVPVRHIEDGGNVPMYTTSVACRPAGRMTGPLVVSMRPIPARLVERAIRVTARYPRVHGAPVHIGQPGLIGVDDLDRPDFGDPVRIDPGEVPVFWACGVTPQAAVMRSKPPLAIAHAPGHMAITDARDTEFRVP
ncbi:putative hydro-lyase [Prauserella alba]|uniref:Putative hydro-lyase GCM10009675_06470 n=1 Tax=Prauserella alba TaxID=176898 RepID=A0ABN1V4G2_9PSEU|nr:putative hydro-lyase [Prauserella alba]MCP2183665.1 Uncharacterized protein YcsI, UPF0317 family [Prauserella alba]